MNNNKEKIIQLIRAKGPVLPSQISKEIEANTIMASAYLSELSSNNLVKISSIKIGGSPLYYLPGQEHRLQDFVNNLHEKERKSYDLLKEKKVLRDSSLDPVFRVTLRNIKDFAVPLKVDHKGSSEIFWKWYLMSNKEAEDMIKSQLKPEAVRKETSKEIKPLKKQSIKIKKKREPIKKEVQKKIEQPKTEEPIGDDFSNKVEKYFSRNNIKVIERKIIRKNKDAEFIVEIPSPVGNLKYFCKAKTKKKINDGDLSSIYIQAQSKKLPVLYLTTGDLTKKAKEMLEKEFKGLKIRQI